MSIGIILGILFIVISLALLVALLHLTKKNQIKDNKLRNFQTYNQKTKSNDDFQDNDDYTIVERKANGDYTLKQKMIYANWHFPPILFSALRWLVAFLCFLLASTYFKVFLSLVFGFLGYAFVNSFLDRAINKRFEAFDKDYPTFLQSVVSLLKSGMNILSAIESASDGLEPSSLLRQEVGIMLERLRMGTGEEKAIGNFGASINHPEIELFIQAIILGKSLGGALSNTLDRLSEQVRKRQYFRNSAQAAIVQQKGSLWVILIILTSILVIIGKQAPDLFEAALASNHGRMVLEVAIGAILGGVYWIKQIVKIKV
ncbi:MAG: type II secretion system F family protein [Bdellovibrionota bacterium]